MAGTFSKAKCQLARGQIKMHACVLVISCGEVKISNKVKLIAAERERDFQTNGLLCDKEQEINVCV